MECLNCGAELHKSDIFCINCEAPVLTDEDLAAIASKDSELEINSNSEDINDVLLSSSKNRLFDSLSLETEEPSGTLRKKAEPFYSSVSPSSKSTDNRKPGSGKLVFITVVIILFAVLLGLVVYFLLRPDLDNNPTPPDVTPPVNTNDPPPTGTDDEPPPDVVFAVASIAVLRSGRIQTEFHVNIGEIVVLTVMLLPEGASGDVTWSSSDPDVIEVVQTDAGGMEATIIGIGYGIADIIVTSGEVVETYAVYVDSMSLTKQFENAYADDETAIWLTISWLDEDRLGQEIVFEQDLENQFWTMESAVERGDIVLEFVIDNDAVIFGIKDSAFLYYLFDDGTGFFGSPGNIDNQDFFWWFKTSLVEPEG